MYPSASVPHRRTVARRLFIAFCLIASAILAYVTGGTNLSLVLYAVSLLLVIVISLVLRHLIHNPQSRRWLVPASVSLLAGVLILSRIRRVQLLFFGRLIGQGAEWVGLSYLVLRLIHVVVDSPKLGEVAAGDLAAYALFPPALIAGPIHRANQFLPQLDQSHYPTTQPKLIDSLWRIGLGTAKKLVVANALSLVALNVGVAVNPTLPRSLLLLSLIAYAFMLYFDFAGYSDIAIGVAGLMGITLPENFANPYAQSTLTRFWQTWHMSLSFWLRDYIFLPLSGTLLRRIGRRWATVVMAISHLVTMTIAGLWHGFSTGFLAWGLWHGTGLFVNAQWSKFARQHEIKLPSIIGIALTFTFVTLGWIFFALPDFGSGLHVLARIAGR